MQEIADVADDSRQYSRDRQLQRRPGRMDPAQRVEVPRKAAFLGTADVELALGRRFLPGPETDRETRESLAEIPDVEGGHATGRAGRQRVHGPARDPPEPPCPEPALAVEQRRPHDEPVGAARSEREFARELGSQESAARPRAEPECRDVNQRQPALPAGLGQRGRRQVMHALVSLAPALAQDADAIEHDIDVAQQAAPIRDIEQALEMGLAAGALARARGQAVVDPIGAAAADHWPGAAGQQAQNRVPADEARGAEHEYGGRAGDSLRARAAFAVERHRTLLRILIFLS